MKICETIRRQLGAPSGGWSRDVLAHCRVCPECRREMLAQLAGSAEEPLTPPPSLEARTLAACRAVHPSRRLSPVALWSTVAVAAACFCIGSGALFFRPSAADSTTLRSKPVPEWSGAGLEHALSEIGQELSAAQQALNMDDLEDRS